jgi:prephenate dehydrogenase
MWRDIAHTNSEAIAASLLALEQRLTHLRENLRTPELRDDFERANRFRLGPTSPALTPKPEPDPTDGQG